MSGYLYRVCPADAARLRALLDELMAFPCWIFGGAALWDFEPARGQANLRRPAQIESAETLAEADLSGDFGHCFSATVEVRWKRCDEASYDVLVLSEAPLALAGATNLANGWATGAPQNVRLSDGRSMGAIPYLAPNGAPQLLRYMEVQ